MLFFHVYFGGANKHEKITYRRWYFLLLLLLNNPQTAAHYLLAPKCNNEARLLLSSSCNTGTAGGSPLLKASRCVPITFARRGLPRKINAVKVPARRSHAPVRIAVPVPTHVLTHASDLAVHATTRGVLADLAPLALVVALAARQCFLVHHRLRLSGQRRRRRRRRRWSACVCRKNTW